MPRCLTQKRLTPTDGNHTLLTPDTISAVARLVNPYIHRGDFPLSSGESVPWYVDGRAFLLDSRNAVIAGQSLVSLLPPDLTCVGGPATAAIPVVAAIIHQSPQPRQGFYVRPAAKDYGLLNRIEGNLASEVAIVDDTCFSGESILSAIAAVEEAGSTVRQVVALFDRDQGGATIRAAGYRYDYVLRLEDGRLVLK